MAGGMNSRRSLGIPLGERVARRRTPTTATTPPRQNSPSAPRTRHCWVNHPELGQLPGLLLHWRNDNHGWSALVVYVDQRGAAITTWVPAAALQPH